LRFDLPEGLGVRGWTFPSRAFTGKLTTAYRKSNSPVVEIEKILTSAPDPARAKLSIDKPKGARFDRDFGS
jgi:hypothetical protein